MTKIYKYPIDITDSQTIHIKGFRQILHAGLDPAGRACVWCMVDLFPDTDYVRGVEIFIVGTGNPMSEEQICANYLNSFNQNEFIWHIFWK